MCRLWVDRKRKIDFQRTTRKHDDGFLPHDAGHSLAREIEWGVRFLGEKIATYINIILDGLSVSLSRWLEEKKNIRHHIHMINAPS